MRLAPPSTLLAAAMLAAPPLHAQSDSATGAFVVAEPDAPPRPKSEFDISGSVRIRYEALDGQFRPGLPDHDDGVFLRTTIAAEYRDAAGWRIGGELIDARAYAVDADSSTNASAVNALEISQLYVGADLGDALGRGSQGRLTAGRFTMDLGSRRLLARNNFRNAINSFTGLKLDRTGAGGDRLLAFAVLPQTRLPDDRASLLDNDVEIDRESFDLVFWGLGWTRPKLIAGATGELHVLGLHEDDGDNGPTRNRQLVTFGARLERPGRPGDWDFDVEANYQLGTIRSSTAPTAERVPVAAALVHAGAGYTFDAPWQPRLAIEFDYATGDDPASRRYTRFDNLFGARVGDYGPTGLFGPLGPANIVIAGARLDVKPDRRLEAMARVKPAWLAEPADSFASTGLVDRGGSSGRYAGALVEARVRYWLIPGRLRAALGGAILTSGDFRDDAPNANGVGTTHYGYGEVTVTF